MDAKDFVVGKKYCEGDCPMVNQYDDEDRTDECVQILINYALANPTKEGA